MMVDGKYRLAHQVAYEIHSGPVQEGMCVLHSCDEPSCVNPDHLRQGTHQENMSDMSRRRRSRASRRGMPRGVTRSGKSTFYACGYALTHVVKLGVFPTAEEAGWAVENFYGQVHRSPVVNR